MIDPTARIHASADLADDVDIGPGTTVGPRTSIGSGTRIGRDGDIGGDVFIDDGVVVGDRFRIQHGAILYRGVTVADGVYIGAAAILTNDRRPRALDAGGGLAGAEDFPVAPIHVASGATIGAGAIVVAGSDVGAYAMVGAGAVVTHTVPGHAIVAGSPAGRIGWACTCGERLLDSTGHPAPAERERYAIDQELVCPACDRRYAYVRDEETLRELDRPVVSGGALA